VPDERGSSAICLWTDVTLTEDAPLLPTWNLSASLAASSTSVGPSPSGRTSWYMWYRTMSTNGSQDEGSSCSVQHVGWLGW
jgi:hypothetical protein